MAANHHSMAIIEEGKTQYIVVTICGEQYGIDISFIDNIVRMQKITRVPKVQSYFKGIINLRGEVVPIMSIRKKMGLPLDEYTDATRMIILKIEEQGKLGIVVDEVREVVTLGRDEIDKVSADVREEKANFINGVGKNGEELVSLFDISSIIDDREIA
ncbi:chemotaxis protein CheW [Clostridia bacterium]|nr:chemotaxis protein CheW [Clostridia bacterium]